MKSKVFSVLQQIQEERDDLYRKFVKAIHEVQQKSSFKNLLLEKKLSALADTLEKKEAQLNEVLSASNLDPTALTVVTRKLEVSQKHCCQVEGFFLDPFERESVIQFTLRQFSLSVFGFFLIFLFGSFLCCSSAVLLCFT